MAYRLWAGGDTELWYTDDGGTVWTQVAGLPGRIEGIWGPTNARKIYTVVDGIGIYTWEEGIGWTLELPNINAAGKFNWAPNDYLSQTWCADDDSLVYTNGIGSAYGLHDEIWLRPGAPGTPWVFAPFGPATIQDVHGTPDGSAVFALEKGAANYRILQETGGGVFVPVHTFAIGATRLYQIRVVSPTEVRLYGHTGSVVEVYLWNGAVLALEYSFNVATLPSPLPPISISSWGGAWSSADGLDGGVAVRGFDIFFTYNIYFRRTAGVWALDDNNIVTFYTPTRSAGISVAADDRLLFTLGRFQRRVGGVWVDNGTEPIGTWSGSPPNGYNMQWLLLPVPVVAGGRTMPSGGGTFPSSSGGSIMPPNVGFTSNTVGLLSVVADNERRRRRGR